MADCKFCGQHVADNDEAGQDDNWNLFHTECSPTISVKWVSELLPNGWLLYKTHNTLFFWHRADLRALVMDAMRAHEVAHLNQEQWLMEFNSQIEQASHVYKTPIAQLI